MSYNFELSITYLLATLFLMTLLLAILSVHLKTNKTEIKPVKRRITLSLYFSFMGFLFSSIKILQPIQSKFNTVDIRVFITTLVTLIFIFLIPLCIVYKHSRQKIIKKVIDIIYYTFLIIGTIFSIQNELAPITILNIYLISTVFYLYSLYLTYEMIQRKSKRKVPTDVKIKMYSESSDAEIETYEELFETRKAQAKYIKNFLEKLNYTESFALAINAEWGKGKTSFIQAIKSELSDGYKFIHINTMKLNKQEKMIDEFYLQLKNIFDQHDIYTGVGSDINHYFSVLKKIASKDNSITNTLDSLLNIKNLNYEKEEIEKNIETIKETYKKKIFIIVDDIDRTDEETIKETLFFIKDVVNFKYCTTVFIMDYQYIKKENQKLDSEYLSKFINKTFNLVSVQYHEIINYYLKNKFFLENFYRKKLNAEQAEHFQTLFYNDIKKLKLEILNLIEKYISANDNGIKKAEINIVNQLNNPRNIKKILRAIEENYIKFFYTYGHNDNWLKSILFQLPEEKSKIIREGILIFSLLEVLFSEEFSYILKHGLNNQEIENTRKESSSLNNIYKALDDFNNSDISKILNPLYFFIPVELYPTDKVIEKLDTNQIETKDIDEILNNIGSYLSNIDCTIYGDKAKARGKKFFEFIIQQYPKNIKLSEILDIVLKSAYYNKVIIQYRFFLEELNNKIVENTALLNSYEERDGYLREIDSKNKEILFNNQYNLAYIITVYYQLSQDLSNSRVDYVINFAGCDRIYEYNKNINDLVQSDILLDLNIDIQRCDDLYNAIKLKEIINKIFSELKKHSKKPALKFINRQITQLKNDLINAFEFIEILCKLKSTLKNASIDIVHSNEYFNDISSKYANRDDVFKIYIEAICKYTHEVSNLSINKTIRLIRVALDVIFALKNSNEEIIVKVAENNLIRKLYEFYLKLNEKLIVEENTIEYMGFREQWFYRGVEIEMLYNKYHDDSYNNQKKCNN